MQQHHRTLSKEGARKLFRLPLGHRWEPDLPHIHWTSFTR